MLLSETTIEHVFAWFGRIFTRRSTMVIGITQNTQQVAARPVWSRRLWVGFMLPAVTDSIIVASSSESHSITADCDHSSWRFDSATIAAVHSWLPGLTAGCLERHHTMCRSCFQSSRVSGTLTPQSALPSMIPGITALLPLPHAKMKIAPSWRSRQVCTLTPQP